MCPGQIQFGIGAPQSGEDWFATTRATVFALLLRVGIASTHLENLSIITWSTQFCTARLALVNGGTYDACVTPSLNV